MNNAARFLHSEMPPPEQSGGPGQGTEGSGSGLLLLQLNALKWG